MSGSLTGIYESISYALQLHGQSISQLQEQASTGNRVNRASDDPSEAYRILGLSSQERSLDSYVGNIADLTGSLQMSSTIITNMASQLADVRTLLSQIVGGIYDADGRKRIAEKVDSALEQLVSLANTKYANQYLFGGNNTGAAPYVVVREGGKIASVTYQGSDEARRVDVAPGLDVAAGPVGDEVFRNDNRGAPVFLGSTGAAAGTGTSSLRGDAWLTVDYNGANYRVSVDDGATFVTVPPGGDTNQAVTDSRTGRVLYVNTTGINKTGVELVRLPGTYDAFNALIGLRDMLTDGHGVASQDLTSYVNECVAGVEEVRNRLVQANVTTGSQIGFLDTLKQNLETMQYDTQDQTTRLQQADVAQIAIDLSREQVLYQMSLSVAGKLMTMSLLDFIQ
ncbi:MAG: flagellar hook-associated protein FlgL [Phycisphaerae bacterium]|nr:flagellar hook-associated protein FlgL [Phycisphaerae bacterium]